jgi:hypothetical protein
MQVPGTGCSGRSADGRQPPQQKEVVAAKRTAIGPENPMDGLLHDVANAYASKIYRFAVRTLRLEHNCCGLFLTVGFRRASGSLDVAPEGGR